MWLGIIIYLSFTPLRDWPQPTIFQKLYIDKVVHITMYAILSILLLFAIWRQQKKQPLRYAQIVYVLIFTAGIGIAVEIFQPILTFYRRFEWLDMLANAGGAAAGWLIFKWIIYKRSRLKTIPHQ